MERVRISVHSGERSVHIKIKGSSAKLLALAEDAARRLLQATPEPTVAQPFGFTATSDHDPSERLETLGDHPAEPVDQETVTQSREATGG